MTVGTDLEDFVKGLYDDKQLNGEDEGCWEEILDDEWAEIEGRNSQSLAHPIYEYY